MTDKNLKPLKPNLNKAFENNIRLNIMSILMVEDDVNFNELKDSLQLTDGNLASHIKALEKLSYINIKKKFIGRKPNTTYQVSTKGRKAFMSHLDELQNILNKHK